MSFLKCSVCHSLRVALYLSWIVFSLGAYAVQASDHLDTPTVIANPDADIGDLYAWTSSDGHRLNLVTISGAAITRSRE
jgi:hypothetical protein